MRVVIDTNVLISRFLSTQGLHAQVFTRLAEQAFELVVSEPILAEYQAALLYPGGHSPHRHGRHSGGGRR